MGLFDKKEHEQVTYEPANQPVERSSSRKGLFGRRRSNSPEYVNNANTTGNRQSPRHSTRSSTSGGGGFFNRDKGDPSISQARQRVMEAEQSERDADRALAHARQSVREAKEHVRRLEAEAAEDARRAKIKQKEAHDLGKRSNPLGRHG